MIQSVKVHNEEKGLHLNISKTKIMMVDKNRMDFNAFMIRSERGGGLGIIHKHQGI